MLPAMLCFLLLMLVSYVSVKVWWRGTDFRVLVCVKQQALVLRQLISIFSQWPFNHTLASCLRSQFKDRY